jgi:hypothetical protein
MLPGVGHAAGTAGEKQKEQNSGVFHRFLRYRDILSACNYNRKDLCLRTRTAPLKLPVKIAIPLIWLLILSLLRL